MKPHDQVSLEQKHDQRREQQRDQRERTNARNELSAVPLFSLGADQDKAGQEPGHEGNAQIEPDALRDLSNSNRDDASLKAEPPRQYSEENPGVKAVEQDLKDAVDGDQAGNIVRVSLGQLIPDQHHRDTPGDADLDQTAHVGRFTTQEDDSQ